MSIALGRSGEKFDGSGCLRVMGCMPVFDSPEILAGDVAGRVEEELGSCTSSSSSIGKNSDLSRRSSDGDDSGETEVQSSYKGPLDALGALEEVLPIRRGISNFYHGKSKSFTSLADASSTSIKDIVKPENAYSRKRRNLLAYNHIWDRNRNFTLRSNGGGITKRPLHLSRSTLALAVAMSSSESNNSSDDSHSNSSSRSPPPLPPLHPHTKPLHSNNIETSLAPTQQNFPSWRSLSLADLQACTTAAATSTSPSLIGNNAVLRKLT